MSMDATSEVPLEPQACSRMRRARDDQSWRDVLPRALLVILQRRAEPSGARTDQGGWAEARAVLSVALRGKREDLADAPVAFHEALLDPCCHLPAVALKVGAAPSVANPVAKWGRRGAVR